MFSRMCRPVESIKLFSFVLSSGPHSLYIFVWIYIYPNKSYVFPKVPLIITNCFESIDHTNSAISNLITSSTRRDRFRGS